MPVDNALDAAEIEAVREICGVISLSEIAKKSESQTHDQNVRTRADIVQWEKFNNKFSELHGGGEFGLRKDPEKALLRICNRVRTRFGYLTISNLDELNSSNGNSYCSYTPPASGGYCD